MLTVRQLLSAKSGGIVIISPQASVFKALELMAEKDIGALLVIEEGKLVGIFSERDYARKLVLKGRNSRETAVADLMVTDVLYVMPQHSIEQCMRLMTEKKVRHLPVLEDGRLIGIVSIGDVVKAIISDQADTIRLLELYITSGRSK